MLSFLRQPEFAPVSRLIRGIRGRSATCVAGRPLAFEVMLRRKNGGWMLPSRECSWKNAICTGIPFPPLDPLQTKLHLRSHVTRRRTCCRGRSVERWSGWSASTLDSARLLPPLRRRGVIAAGSKIVHAFIRRCLPGTCLPLGVSGSTRAGRAAWLSAIGKLGKCGCVDSSAGTASVSSVQSRGHTASC